MNPVTPKYDEAARLQAVRGLGLLDSLPEPEYDELVKIAAAICDVPISLLSLIDDKREWYKANIGMSIPELPQELTFCRHTIRQDDILLVEDTLLDDRFSAHPAVLATPSIRFYAGIPIKTSDGYPVGTICIADFSPRHLSPAQLEMLKGLAHHANALLALREQRITLVRALAEAEQIKDRLAASEARFKTFMDSSPFMSFLKDTDGRFVFYNRILCEQFHISPTEWLGLSVHDIFPAADADQYRGNDLDVLRLGKLQVMDEVTYHPDRSPITWRSYKFPCTAEDGSAFLGGVSIDITDDLRQRADLESYRLELEEANLQLRELATTDSLTGLPNRRAFDDRLTVEFAQARRSLRPLSIVLLDVDNFKQHNDRFGHEAGDATLRQFASLLRSTARAGDLVARYGGEEFVLLLPDTDEDQAAEVAGRILTLVRSTPWTLEPITTSAGVACMAAATPSPTRLVTLADEALYVAKRAGKDRCIGYSHYFQELVAILPTKVT